MLAEMRRKETTHPLLGTMQTDAATLEIYIEDPQAARNRSTTWSTYPPILENVPKGLCSTKEILAHPYSCTPVANFKGTWAKLNEKPKQGAGDVAQQ